MLCTQTENWASVQLNWVCGVEGANGIEAGAHGRRALFGQNSAPNSVIRLW